MSELRRDLTLTHGIAIVVGITIGTGVSLKSAPMAQAVGSPLLVMAAWAVAGLVAVLGALCFAASDMMIGIARFLVPFETFALGIWWTYAAAQVLLVAGIVSGRSQP